MKFDQIDGSLDFWNQKLDLTYKWRYKWVTGVVTPISGVKTLLITGRGPCCRLVKYSNSTFPIEYDMIFLGSNPVPSLE